MKTSFLPPPETIVCPVQIFVSNESGDKTEVCGYLRRTTKKALTYEGTPGLEYSLEVSEHLPSAGTFVLAGDGAAMAKFSTAYDAGYWGGYWRDVLAYCNGNS